MVDTQTQPGDIFYQDHVLSTKDEVHVIYGGGAAAAKLITIESGVTSPQVGYVYRIGGASTPSSGYSGNGKLASTGSFYIAHNLVVDSNLNIYVADTSNNVVRRIDGTTGILTSYAGGSGAGCVSGTEKSCTATFAGDNGPAGSASLNAPDDLALDANGNLYIADTGNKRIRAVYATGTLPGISNPVIGNIYTVIGGGTGTSNGTSAPNLGLTSPTGVSLDNAGNVYVIDGGAKLIWRVNPQSLVATQLAGGGGTLTVGGYCSGTSGPKATDSLGDGCPATLATLSLAAGPVVFDINGVAYVADTTGQVVRSFTFNAPIADTSVGSTSTLPIAFSSSSGFVTPTVTVTTQGSASPDFSVTPTSCALTATLAANTICSYNVTFAPTLPGRRVASIQAASSSFSSTLNGGLDAKGLASLLSVSPATATSVVSSVVAPGSVTANAVGGVYVSDAVQGTVSTGTAGGVFTVVATGLSKPMQTAVDGAGNLFIADSGNNRIVEVPAGGAVTPLITGLSVPSGAVSTGRGVLYIADTGNNRILKYDTGTLTTLPVSGLSGPTQLALDASGTLYIVDPGNSRIVTFSTTNGAQSTVLLPFTVLPAGVAVDAADDVYFSDALSAAVYELANGSSTASTIASSLKTPAGLSIDGNGILYYTDSTSGAVVKVNQMTSALTFARTQIASQSASQNLTLSNIGNQPLTFNSSNTYVGTGNTADFAISQGATACGAGPVAVGASCNLNAIFQPIAVAQYSEALTFPSNAPASAAVTLTGTGVFLVKTSLAVSLTTSGGISYGQSAGFSVTITPAVTTTVPTGTLTITDSAGGQPLTLNLSGTSAMATFSLTLAPGAHVISVTYSGDNVYVSSFNTYTVTVTKQATTSSISYTTVTQSATPSITFTVKVAGSVAGTTGAPTLTVTLYNGTAPTGTLVGTATLNAQGVATITPKTVAFPTYSFYAVYSGDPNYAASTSPATTLGGDFGVSTSVNALSAAAGVAVSTNVTVTPLFGYTGTVSFSCTGLPAASACRFTPPTLAVSVSTSQQTSIQFFTNLPPSLSAAEKRSATPIFALLGIPMVLLAGVRRRRQLSLRVVAVLLCASGLTLIAGCSGSNPFNGVGSTPAGTSTIVMTATDSTGISHTSTFTLTVYTQ